MAIDLRLQDRGVTGILLRILVPGAEATRLDAVVALEPLLGVGHVADSHLVEHARVPPWHAVAEQLHPPVQGTVADSHGVAIGG